MKLSDIKGYYPMERALEASQKTFEFKISGADEYKGMKVYQFEMNKFELEVARAAVRMLHRHHEFFYRMEMSTEASLSAITEALIAEGIKQIEDVEKMMEAMQNESML